LRPRLNESSLLILICALDSYINELTVKIGELEKNMPNDESETFLAWNKERWTLLMGCRKARKLRLQFMRYLVGDTKGKVPQVWRVKGLDPREKSLDDRFRRLIEESVS